MADRLTLAERLEELAALEPGWYANVGKRTGERCCQAMREAAAALRQSPSVEEVLREARQDIAFLLARSGHAGSASFSPGRWTGLSSNSIVSVAFGGTQAEMPSDRGDYAACVRTYVRLPRHRRTKAVRDALKQARAAYLARYPQERYPAGRRQAREEFERRQAEYYGRSDAFAISRLYGGEG